MFVCGVHTIIRIDTYIHSINEQEREIAADKGGSPRNTTREVGRRASSMQIREGHRGRGGLSQILKIWGVRKHGGVKGLDVVVVEETETRPQPE